MHRVRSISIAGSPSTLLFAKPARGCRASAARPMMARGRYRVWDSPGIVGKA
jgi:hypothetical protein